MNVTIRFEEDLVPKKLHEVAKKSGYTSREEFLRDVLTDVALSDTFRTRDLNMKRMVERYEELTEMVATSLNMQTQLMLQRQPVIASEGGKMNGHN